MQRIRVFERKWFSDDDELETQVNNHLQDFPHERVISMTYGTGGTGINNSTTGDPDGYDTLIILVEVQED